MSLPLIAAGAGILALVALASSSSTSATTKPASSAPGGNPTMPPALKTQFDDLMTNGLNADGLETVATQMESFGFALEASALRARAAQIRAAQLAQAQKTPTAAPPAAPPPAPIPTAQDPNLQAQINPLSVPAGGLQAQINPLSVPVVPPPAPAPQAQQARVTTSDPAPSGDLIMRVAPDPSADQVPGGGAEKDGVVTIVNPNASPDGVWAEIIWAGGSRRPAARGFAKKQFLAALPPSPTTSGVVVGAAGTNYAKCVAPAGCRLRVAPNTGATFRALIGNGEMVQLLLHAKGQKGDFGSPGPGGWAQVQYKGLLGWVPSEWLQAA